MDQFKSGDRVVVIGADKETYWYADRIGETFTLDRSFDGGKSWLVKEETCHYLMESDIVLEEDEEGVDTDSQSATIIFDPEQLREAGMMISELNVAVNLTAEEVEDTIYDIIKSEVAKGLHKAMTVATLGFIIRFADVYEGVTVVEVSVDPNVGKDSRFISATLDSNGYLAAHYPNR